MDSCSTPEHGLVATGPVEQTRSWFISSILRVPTTAGDVYFKAVPPMDVHEPLLTQQEHLQQIVPCLKSSCIELAHLDIPASVHHGDFHRGNIIVHETGCTLLDWSGFIGVTHPFLSLWVPLNDWDPSARKILSESYLEVWSHYAPLEHLRPALALAHPLAALCGALGHRYQINHAHTVLAWDILISIFDIIRRDPRFFMNTSSC